MFQTEEKIKKKESEERKDKEKEELQKLQKKRESKVAREPTYGFALKFIINYHPYIRKFSATQQFEVHNLLYVGDYSINLCHVVCVYDSSSV